MACDWAYQNQRLDEALELALTLVELAPSSSETWTNLMAIRVDLKDWDAFPDFVSHKNYGLRFDGNTKVSKKVKLVYTGEYALQKPYAGSPSAVDADYTLARIGVAVAGVTVRVGYEKLGGDGTYSFQTPFATLHKFNGFADVFLNNGGLRGLRDLYVSIAPDMPFEAWTLKLIFHQFWDDQGGDVLGQEYDLVMTYRLNEFVSFLWKAAYFDGGKRRSPTDAVTRSTLQTTFRF